MRILPATLALCLLVLAGPNADGQDNQRGPLDINVTILAAEQGDAYAQSLLGGMYYFGNSVSQNYTEAIRWYRLSAAQGFARGQFALGDGYYFGNGTPQDYIEAAKWYRLAAEQGETNAQALLGYMYQSGAGVRKDFVRAHMWMNLAVSAMPDSELRDSAVEFRDSIAETLTVEDLSRAQALARDWKPKSP